MSNAAASLPITTAVFIDSDVPDLQMLLAGALPGERVFVLDPAKDGLTQIAQDLETADLGPLDAIGIVAHGEPGSLSLGGSAVDATTLPNHAAALATIGGALASTGALALYACGTAAGAAGRTFIADISKFAGATVHAATRAIGRTDMGPNWTLDATSAMPAEMRISSVAPPSPFSAAAMQGYQGTLANGPTGQLIVLSSGSHPDQYLNSDSTTATAFRASSGMETYGYAVDTVLGVDFYQSPDDGDGNYSGGLDQGIFAGTLTTPEPSHDQPQWQAFYAQTLRADVESFKTALARGNPAIDKTNHVIYQGIGSDIASENGIVAINYSVNSAGAVSFDKIAYLETFAPDANGFTPSFLLDSVYANSNYYFSDSTGLYAGQNSEDGLYRASTAVAAGSAVTPTALVTGAQVGGNANVIDNLAFDNASDRIYFDTFQVPSNNTRTAETLYAVSHASTATSASGDLAKITYAAGVTAPTYGAITGMAFDSNANVLYVSNQKQVNQTSTSNSEIDALHFDSSGTNVISVTIIPYSSFATATDQSGGFKQIAFDSLPTLTIIGTTASATTGSSVTLLGGTPTTTDFDSGGYLSSATVKITDNGAAVSGDVLGITDGTTFHTFGGSATAYTDHGHTFLVSYANGVLTIANQPGTAGENTIAAYNQILQDVQYKDNSSDFSDRTVTFQVNDGAFGAPAGPTNSKSFTLDVAAQPPTIKAGGFTAADIEGQTATGGAGAALVGDSDPNGGTLSITKVNGQAANVGASVSGQYGELTLNADGSYSYVADQTAAIDGAIKGARPTDSFTFTVTTSEGTSANETFQVSIDRAPDVGGAGTTVTFTSGASPVAVDPNLTVADLDGDAIASATATIADFQTDDALGLTSDAVDAAGRAGITLTFGNGTLTLSGNASAADYQAVLDGLTYSSAATDPSSGGADQTRTVQVSVSDGTTSSQVVNNSVVVYPANTQEVSYTAGKIYDPTSSTPVAVTAYTGTATSYTVVVTQTAGQGTKLTIDNGSTSQDVDYAATALAFRLDYSDNVAAVSLTGGNYGDVLIGGAGGDTLIGGAGDDLLSGGAGVNTIDGGSGANTVSYAGYGSGVSANLGNKSASATGLADTLTGIQNIIGTSFNDTLVGDRAMNILEGGAGADKIKSGGGGGDFASYVHADPTVGVTVDMADMTLNTGDARGDRFMGIHNVYGSAGNDTLIGNGSANILVGIRGSDTIEGMGGADRIRIRETPTSVDGGDGRDTLVIVDGTSPVMLDTTNFVNFEKVQVADGGSVDMSGYVGGMYVTSGSTTSGRADIVGSNGADHIHAGAGMDTITGGIGDDGLFAGAGHDSFEYMMAGFGRDVIYNANLSLDTFDVGGMASNVNGLHFQSAGGGHDTLVYGDNAGATTDTFVLKGITVQQATDALTRPDSPFKFG